MCLVLFTSLLGCFKLLLPFLDIVVIELGWMLLISVVFISQQLRLRVIWNTLVGGSDLRGRLLHLFTSGLVESGTQWS